MIGGRGTSQIQGVLTSDDASRSLLEGTVAIWHLIMRSSVMGFDIRRWRRRKAKSKRQKQQSGRTSVKDLPFDISLNILRKLPITSLLSLRLVSKASYHLASHPMLTPHYQNLQKNRYCLIVQFFPSYIDKPYYNNDLYLVDNWEVVRKIIHPRMNNQFKAGPRLSCNGLLCLLFYRPNHPYLDYYRACLYNPLTGEFDFLPDPGLPRVREPGHNYTIVVSDQYFGFGFSPRTREYKLVRISRCSYEDGRTYCQTTIFTLGKNGCQDYEIHSPFVCPDQSSDVVVGGAIHWLCEGEKSTWFDIKLRSILSFDLFEEKFQLIPKPNCQINRFCKISVLGGCLALTGDFNDEYGIHEVHIWVLKEYGVKESWTKEFVLRESFPITFGYHGSLCPLFLLDNGKILMSYNFKAFCWYDPKEECFTCYAELDQSFRAICHVPSLVSPFF